MEHILENPGWGALTRGNAWLAEGNDEVRFFDKEVSPFVGFAKNTDEHFRILFDIAPGNGARGFISPAEITIPAFWKVLHVIPALQMVHTGDAPAPDPSVELVPLTEEQVPQMLALTKLTNPGPFALHTIKFGHYRGVFNGDRLVAMAGQRLHPQPYAEISAVCTHPDHTGKGYARQLLLHQVQRIKAAGEIPFLHVRDDNTRAVKVYEDTGFTVSRRIWFYILQKNI